MTMIGTLLDERFESVLIDEPELGLAPKVQQQFADIFQDPHKRQEKFPHLKQVFLATHSHVFLSRRDIQSNFTVTKQGNKISVEQIKSISDFHRLQFNLLGNSLENMFFPGAIVIVEGKTDKAYLDKLLQLRFPDGKITVTGSGGDVKRRVYTLKDVFGGLTASPFRNRLFVVLDSVHQRGLVAELVKQGLPQDNAIVWSKNGIEYLYPEGIVAGIYGCTADQVEHLNFSGDAVVVNGIAKTKDELSREVLMRLKDDTPLPAELCQFIDKVGAAIKVE